jgi:hypothetical protein
MVANGRAAHWLRVTFTDGAVKEVDLSEHSQPARFRSDL